MKEILTGRNFKNAVEELNLTARETYKESSPSDSYREPYSVWELSDESYDIISDIEEDDWKGEWGWWRYAEGTSIEGSPKLLTDINSKEIIVWLNEVKFEDRVNDEIEDLEEDEEVKINPNVETFEGTKNAIFFALYNYYGYEGQHFTNKWLGMNDALKAHGITVTGYEGQKDARKFKITREPDCDLPEDTVIFMVNNQNWDSGIQFTKPFAQHHPMVVISTCNGVEFASSPILSSGDKISNATMGGFSPTYREAFVNGSLTYLVAKYSAHLAPIFAAAVNAVETGEVMRNADGSALHLSISTWASATASPVPGAKRVMSVS